MSPSSTSRRLVRTLVATTAFGAAIAGAFGSAAADPTPAPAVVATGSPASPAGAADEGAPSDPLLHRVIALSTAIKTYQAVIHADVAFHSFPFITTHLDGNVYFKAPDHQAVVFDTVPLLAGSIKKFYPNVPSPSRWSAIYTIAPAGDTGGLTTYRLVPKKHGRVQHLDVVVDDARATVESYTWTYEDGGDISFVQTFTMAGGHPVVATQTGRVDLPSYKADVTSKIENYKLNVPVADSVFEEK